MLYDVEWGWRGCSGLPFGFDQRPSVLPLGEILSLLEEGYCMGYTRVHQTFLPENLHVRDIFNILTHNGAPTHRVHIIQDLIYDMAALVMEWLLNPSPMGTYERDQDPWELARAREGSL